LQSGSTVLCTAVCTPKLRKLCLVLYVRYRLSRIRTGSERIGNFESLKWSATCCFSICGGHGTTHTNTFSKLRCADGSAKHCIDMSLAVNTSHPSHHPRAYGTTNARPIPPLFWIFNDAFLSHSGMGGDKATGRHGRLRGP
jgi:hypothetical protein